MPIFYLKSSLLALPRPVKILLVVSFDLALCIFSFWLSFGLRLDSWTYYPVENWRIYSVAIGAFIPLFVFFGLYRAVFRFIGSVAFLSIVLACTLYSVFTLIIFTVIGVIGVPRSIGIIHPIFFFIGVGSSRLFIHYFLNNIDSKKFSQKKSNILIYGAGRQGRQILASLSNINTILVKGFVDDNPKLQGREVNGVFVYSNDNLKDLVYRLGISDLFLAISNSNQQIRNNIISSNS